MRVWGNAVATAKMQQIKLDIRPFYGIKRRKCRVQASVERCAKFCASMYKVALSLVAIAGPQFNSPDYCFHLTVSKAEMVQGKRS